MTAYKYQSLEHCNSIRLLTLHAGETLSPISISLHHVRLHDEAQYEALSYTWATEDDDASLSSVVKCDGVDIGITKNCESALGNLRSRDSDRVLWVDAICINQKDEEEKSLQVAKMRDIYRKATNVPIWLGGASERIDEGSGFSISHHFLDYISRLGVEIRNHTNAGRKAEISRSSPTYQILIEDVIEFNLHGIQTSLIQGLLDIVLRRWWMRIWVIQEAALATSAILICSTHSVSYANFFDWYRLIQSDKTPVSSPLWRFLHNRDHLESVRQAREADGAQMDLSVILKILYRARRLQSSNPVDKIFGILGLFEYSSNTFPSPDYNKSPTEVFVEVTKRFISQSKGLQILTQASSAAYAPDHPSWVAIWSQEPILSYSPNWWEDYNAARDSHAVYSISSDNKILHVNGICIDSVTSIPLVDLQAYKGTVGSYSTRILGWQQSCRTGLSLNEYPTGESIQDALWRTLCGNYDTHWNYPASIETGKHFEWWHRILSSDNDMDSMEKEMMAQKDRFGDAVRSTAPVCTTRKGLLASVPYTTETGDCIAVLTGGRVPFVLRPMGDYYYLVGPCYVHGVMDGEAFSEDLDELEWISMI